MRASGTPPRIVIACDSFKESLDAVAVGRAIEAGMRAVLPDAIFVQRPMADGGEGTSSTLAAGTGGRLIPLTVTGPLGEPVTARIALLGDGTTAVIELAEAAGLALVPPPMRDPMRATTFGVGEMIRAALDAGARRLVLALGGSATNDGGAGLLQALGARLLDSLGQPLLPGGGALETLARIETAGLDARLADARIEIACDVDNPLIGPDGASAVFGPQKGADGAAVARLDSGLSRLAALLEPIAGRTLVDVPGLGAAGGAGLGLVACAGASLVSGCALVADVVGLEDALAGADLVVTGEGRLDAQSVRGKVPVGVARLAGRHGVPVIALAGAVGSGVEAVHAHGIAAVFPVVRRPCTLSEALAEAEGNLTATARNVAALLAPGIVR